MKFKKYIPVLLISIIYILLSSSNYVKAEDYVSNGTSTDKSYVDVDKSFYKIIDNGKDHKWLTKGFKVSKTKNSKSVAYMKYELSDAGIPIIVGYNNKGKAISNGLTFIANTFDIYSNYTLVKLGDNYYKESVTITDNKDTSKFIGYDAYISIISTKKINIKTKLTGLISKYNKKLGHLSNLTYYSHGMKYDDGNVNN